MNPWIEFLTVIVEVALPLYFFTAFWGESKIYGFLKYLYPISYGIILFLLSFCLETSFLRSLLIMLVTYFAAKLYYNRDWLGSIYPTFLFFCAAILSDVLCGAILQLGGLTINSILGDGPTRIIYNGMCKLLHLLSLYVILSFVKRRYSTDALIKALPLFSCQILSIYICFQNFIALANGVVPTTIILETVGLLYINILICAYVEILSLSFEKQKEAELNLQQLEVQKSHYLDVIARQEETRMLWHDIKKYFVAMESLVSQENLAEAQQCLNDLHSSFSSLEQSIYSGNTLIDSIMTYGVNKATEYNVQIEPHIWVDAHLSIPASDLFVIIGNTLDNAIEACSLLPNNQSRVVSITLCQKNRLLLYEITNNHQGGKQPKVGRIHGYGLRNVKTCVERNGGEISITDEDGKFVVSIQLCIN